jgi:hypothetical protein
MTGPDGNRHLSSFAFGRAVPMRGRAMTIDNAAAALSGEVAGRSTILCPGPGTHQRIAHSP